MSSNHQVAVISLTSGVASIGGYLLLKNLYNKYKNRRNHSKQEASKIYEEKALLDQYMLFNFSEPYDMLLFDLHDYSNINNCFLFPKRIALLCRDRCPDIFFSNEVNFCKKHFCFGFLNYLLSFN